MDALEEVGYDPKDCGLHSLRSGGYSSEIKVTIDFRSNFVH